MINRALRVFDGAKLDFDHWNAFVERLCAETRFRLQLPKRFFTDVSAKEIRIKRSQKPFSSFSYSLPANRSLYISEIDATLSCQPLRQRPRIIRKQDPSFDVFDAAKLSFPLTVRNRTPGDRFQPLGQSKFLKLKKLLINRRIPQEERDRLPLVFSDGTIAWVGGVGMAEPFKAVSKTRQFVRLSLTPGKQISPR